MFNSIYHFSDKKTFRHWLRIGRTTFCLECPFGKKATSGTGINIDIDGDENTVILGLGIYHLFHLYFNIEGFFPKKWMYKIGSRITGIDLYEDYIFIDFFHDDDCMDNRWKGLHWSINWKAFLFGRQKFNSKFLYYFREDIPMPEGNYGAISKKEIDTWSRKRIKKPLSLTRFTIIPDSPVPEPGDGENDWDQEDDAVYEMIITANDSHEAIQEFMSSVIKQREMHGGKNWIPEKGWPI